MSLIEQDHELEVLPVRVGDYIVAMPEGKDKSVALKVLTINRGMVTGVVVETQHIVEARKLIDVPVSNVFINLGSKPKGGKVYGHDLTQRYTKSSTHPEFGNIHWMYDVSEAAENSISIGFNMAYTALEKHGLHLMAQDDIVWEVQSAEEKSKYAGWYAPARKLRGGKKMPPRISIKPEMLTADEYAYVVLHELGHHLHYTYLTNPKLDAAWVKLYDTSIKRVDISVAECTEIYDYMLTSECMPSNLKKALDSEEKALAYQWVLRYIKQTHAIGVHELDLLFQSEEFEEIRSMWPTKPLARKELAPIISEYATTHYEECLAEAFAFYLTGRQLPKNVVKLLDKTFSYAKEQFTTAAMA
jgi:hypothetical protein